MASFLCWPVGDALALLTRWGRELDFYYITRPHTNIPILLFFFLKKTILFLCFILVYVYRKGGYNLFIYMDYRLLFLIIESIPLAHPYIYIVTDHGPNCDLQRGSLFLSAEAPRFKTLLDHC